MEEQGLILLVTHAMPGTSANNIIMKNYHVMLLKCMQTISYVPVHNVIPFIHSFILSLFQPYLHCMIIK